MAQTIQIKRGTKAELSSYGALKAGEMGLCTDTKEVYIGDGTANTMVGRALSGPEASRPAAASSGRLYYVTGGTNTGYLYIDDGKTWHRLNAQKLGDLTGTLDDVADGTTYGRVRKSELADGRVSRVSDGKAESTAADIRAHLDDADKHRKINDQGMSNTELWSAQKIRNEIELAKRNIEPQASVKDQHLAAPPASPAEADRYIVPAGATGAWSGRTAQIAEFRSGTWTFDTPAVGWTAYVDDEQKLYSWNGSAWVRTGGALQTVTAGNGLTGGGQADTVTLHVGAGGGITVTADTVAVTAGKGIIVDAAGVAVAVDGTSIVYDAANSNRLTIAGVDGGTF